jgi:WhiB family transcriptional regulator, redox-sensing transcriptional regulator
MTGGPGRPAVYDDDQPCTVPGCVNGARARRLCWSHYGRWRRGMDMDAPLYAAGVKLGTPPPAGWDADAPCRGKTHIFFPDRSSGVGPHRLFAEAKAICAQCPLRAQCLDAALAWENPSERNGVWGGLSPKERAREAARRRRIDRAFTSLREIAS